MQFFKLPWDDEAPRITYHFQDGKTVTINVGDEGVTKEDLRILISLHNKEVRNNNKCCKAPMTETEKDQMREWQEAHPGEKPPKKYHASLDAFFGSDDEMDRSAAMHEAFIASTHEMTPAEERLWEIIDELTDVQRTALVMAKFGDMQVKDIAKQLGKSPAAVCRAIKRAEDYIRNNY